MPIGNVNDLTLRVRDSLEYGKYFFCEDTRNLKKILQILNISLKDKFISSFHDNSSLDVVNKIESIIDSGDDVFYCSDAGSPFVSDPGVKLVNELKKKNISFVSYSGVSSVISALENAGISSTHFSFRGFLPRASKEKASLFKSIFHEVDTIIYFESPHRVQDTLNTLIKLKDEEEVFPDSFYICRELTKKFQEIIEVNVSNIEEVRANLIVKGEFVLIFEQKSKKNKNTLIDEELKRFALNVLEGGGKKKAVSKLVGKILNMNSKEIYESLSEKNRSNFD